MSLKHEPASEQLHIPVKLLHPLNLTPYSVNHQLPILKP